MIPTAFITEWSKQVNWQTPAQVEQDLVLSRALVEIYSNEKLFHSLRFRGGTALYKLFFKKSLRYSEDLDFVQSEPGPIGDDIDSLREVLDPWLGEPKRKRGPGMVTLVYRFISEIEEIPLRLKIEINSREHIQAFPLEKKNFSVSSDWFSGSSEVITYCLEELIGSKLRALYSRKKGRDLFDCFVALREGGIDVSKTMAAFEHYIQYSNQTITASGYRENLLDKLEDPVFQNDMRSLLVPVSYTHLTLPTICSV